MPKSAWAKGLTALVVADAPDALQAALLRAGFETQRSPDPGTAPELLTRGHVDVLLLHGVLTGVRETLLHKATRHQPPIPVVVLGTTGAVEEAVLAMKRGASDYLPPPVDAGVLSLRLRRLLRTESGEAHHISPPRVPREVQAYVGLLGESAAMQELLMTLVRISRYTCNVLLLGESGTGKELVARAVHALGPRKSKLFVPINCATLGRDILENELFGHERGAYTGASERKRGLFEQADGGTLFLDEIGEMDPSTQAKLLRVLERGEFRRVGGTEKVKVDLSVVAATNRNLVEAVKAGSFRSDLYYRLKVVTVTTPPLRERKEDIPVLVDAFIEDFNRRNNGKIAGIAPPVMRRLTEHHWPGNVRELKNAVESAAVMAAGDTLEIDPLPPDAGPSVAVGRPVVGGAGLYLKPGTTLAQAERELILAAVADHPTHARAAASLGIGLRTLQAKLATYGHTRRRAAG